MFSFVTVETMRTLTSDPQTFANLLPRCTTGPRLGNEFVDLSDSHVAPSDSSTECTEGVNQIGFLGR